MSGTVAAQSTDNQTSQEVVRESQVDTTQADSIPLVILDDIATILDGIAGAMQELEIAISHTGFLQDALALDELNDAYTHSEHVINIIEGENSSLYGDIDQNGQIQNPGNGVGIRTYVEEILSLPLAIQATIESADNLSESEGATRELAAGLNEILVGIERVQSLGFDIVGTEASAEAVPISEAMDIQLTTTMEDLTLAQRTATILLENLSETVEPSPVEASSEEEESPDVSEFVAASLAETQFAQEQLMIAIQHAGFLQQSIVDDDLTGVYLHTEHVINVLDGETGQLFGDLDQNGQPQNPGDGVGVLVYLGNAAEGALELVAILDTHGSESDEDGGEDSTPDASEAAAEAVRAINDSVSLIQDAQINGLELLSSVEISGTVPIAESLEAALVDVSQHITDAVESFLLLSASAEPLVLEIQDELDSLAQQIAGAIDQTETAIQHTGFLDDSLAAQELEGAHLHAEHIINTTVGEEGDLFGDLDQNGQTQNPGDGVGIVVYVAMGTESLLLIEDALRDAPIPQALAEEATRLTDSYRLLPEQLDSAIDAALQVMAATSIEDAEPALLELRERLTTTLGVLQSNAESLGILQEIVLEQSQDSVTPDAAIREQILAAQEQLAIANQHVGFLLDALALDDLSQTRLHAEHVINILQGENGSLYGDLDRNGTIQNPGDGIGVRQYLANAEELYGQLISDPMLNDFASQLDELLASLTIGQSEIEDATRRTNQIFAADTADEAQSFADDTSAFLVDANEAIDVMLQIQFDSDGEEVATEEDTESDSAIDTSSTLPPPLNPDAGTQWQNPSDGAIYIYISGGEWTLGATDELAISPLEQPVHTVELPGFWIQQTEVTNAQYAACVEDGICLPPENEQWNQADFAEHPVFGIRWEQARNYAEWVGARLPTEAEWEAACRSGDQRVYPWGNQPPTEDLANIGNSIGETTPVGSYPDGANEYGILDMSGNVWEWTSSINLGYPYNASDGREDATAEGKRVVRGGSFSYTQYQARCVARTGFATDAAGIGMRLVLPTDGDQWVNPLDGATYIYVADGEFTMGLSEADSISPLEEPDHIVSVDGFWMQQTETTNAQYAQCVADGVCDPPDNDLWNEEDMGEQPVTDVNWLQAQEYATFVGGRLPTEAEWEKACRGTDQRLYPWGNTQPNRRLSNFNSNENGPVAVGSYPSGSSPFGILDLSGNVWEWTSSLEVAYPYDEDDGREDLDEPGKRILRGGSFYYTQYQISCTARTGLEGATQGQNFGFRVVVDR
ncbi:MAG: SUMF1/EgtB/PvdO family nonheme iron enzyme [Chloroflexota bacterium]